MADLSNIIKVTQAQYDTLKNGGTVGSHTYDENAIYLVDEPAEVAYVTYQAYDLNGNGYRLWSNGWVDQWGYLSQGASYTSSTINVTFTVPFKTDAYNAQATALSGVNYIDGAWITERTATGMVVHTGSQATQSTRLQCCWVASG